MAIGLVSGSLLRSLSRRSGSAISDSMVFGLLLGVVGLLILYGRQMSEGYVREAPIELSLSALPAYAGLSLSRCLAAMLLSLVFTIIYGSIAAHSRRADRFMIPALDVLQTIPVLSFLPPVTLALITLMPGNELRAGIGMHHHDFHRPSLEYGFRLLSVHPISSAEFV